MDNNFILLDWTNKAGEQDTKSFKPSQMREAKAFVKDLFDGQFDGTLLATLYNPFKWVRLHKTTDGQIAITQDRGLASSLLPL